MASTWFLNIGSFFFHKRKKTLKLCEDSTITCSQFAKLFQFLKLVIFYHIPDVSNPNFHLTDYLQSDGRDGFDRWRGKRGTKLLLQLMGLRRQLWLLRLLRILLRVILLYVSSGGGGGILQGQSWRRRNCGLRMKMQRNSV